MKLGSNLWAWGLLAFLAVAPTALFYWLGAQGSSEEEKAAMLVAGRAKREKIERALSEELARSATLRRERKELQQQLAANSEAVLERLRKQIAARRTEVKEQDLWVLDESLSLEEFVQRSLRAELPETPGAELSAKLGSRGFEAWVRFSADSAAATDFGPLADALSRFPRKGERRWVKNLYLSRPGAHPYPTRLLKLSAEAWRELLEGYQQTHQGVSATYVDNLRGERGRVGELRVTLSESIPTPHALTIVGPKRVECRVEPGGVVERRLPAGIYVLRSAGATADESIWLHIFKIEARRRVKFTLELRK